MMTGSLALESFVDEAIRLAAVQRYHPTAFIAMRARYGTIEAISRLVMSGDIQSGFKKLHELKLAEWTIEEAVVKFPNEFAKSVFECTVWRIKQAKS